jgi:hypothetical protein
MGLRLFRWRGIRRATGQQNRIQSLRNEGRIAKLKWRMCEIGSHGRASHEMTVTDLRGLSSSFRKQHLCMRCYNGRVGYGIHECRESHEAQYPGTQTHPSAARCHRNRNHNRGVVIVTSSKSTIYLECAYQISFPVQYRSGLILSSTTCVGKMDSSRDSKWNTISIRAAVSL